MAPVSRILAWFESLNALLAFPAANACLAAAAAENTLSSSSLSDASVPQGDDIWDCGDPGAETGPSPAAALAAA